MTSPLRRLVALAASLAAPCLVLAGLLLGLPATAQAANIVVSTCTAANLHAAILSATVTNGGLVTFACPGGAHTFTLTQTQTISRAITIDGGGVITISGGNSVRLFNVPAPEKATLLNLTLARGSASSGGALSVSGLAVITNVTFISNVATSAGGAILINGSGTADIYTSHFYSNTASVGGAIDSQGGLGLAGSYFFRNFAVDGGALDLFGGVAVVADSQFVSNTSEFGGAIDAHSSLFLVRDEFDHNATPVTGPHSGVDGGGALFAGAGAYVQIRDSLFFSNTAKNPGGGGAGGAISNAGFLTVTSTLFNENSAVSDGGALYNTAIAYFNASTFLHNHALADGGAISNTDLIFLQSSTLVTNSAGASGGAIATSSGISFTSGLFFNNRAGGGGGAVRVYPHGAMDIADSTLYSNTAVTGAGGAALNNGKLGVTSSTLVANDAGASGGAILSSGVFTPLVVLEADTIVSNTAASAGAGLRQIDGEFDLIDTIVAYNTLFNCQGSFHTLGSNLQYPGLSCVGGITSTDPLLGPLQNNGGPRVGVFGVALLTLRPQPGSPAIDAVTLPVACSAFADERLYARVAPCDIGAIEHYLLLWLPIIMR